MRLLVFSWKLKQRPSRIFWDCDLWFWVRDRLRRPGPRLSHFSRLYVQTHSMCFNVTTRLASSLTYSFNNFIVLFHGIFFVVEGRHSKACQLSLSSVLSFYRTVVCQSCLCFDITSPTSCGPSALISLIVPSSIKMVGIVDKLTC